MSGDAHLPQDTQVNCAPRQEFLNSRHQTPHAQTQGPRNLHHRRERTLHISTFDSTYEVVVQVRAYRRFVLSKPRLPAATANRIVKNLPVM
jgi:hypothetical protein